MPSGLKNAPRFSSSNSHNVSVISMLRDRYETALNPRHLRDRAVLLTFTSALLPLTLPSTYIYTHTHRQIRSPIRLFAHPLADSHIRSFTRTYTGCIFVVDYLTRTRARPVTWPR